MVHGEKYPFCIGESLSLDAWTMFDFKGLIRGGHRERQSSGVFGLNQSLTASLTGNVLKI